jgi:hypothetical protein
VTDAYEPRQVRKEAAVSRADCVVELSTPLLGDEGCAGEDSNKDARPRVFQFFPPSFFY